MDSLDRRDWWCTDCRAQAEESWCADGGHAVRDLRGALRWQLRQLQPRVRELVNRVFSDGLQDCVETQAWAAVDLLSGSETDCSVVLRQGPDTFTARWRISEEVWDDRGSEQAEDTLVGLVIAILAARGSLQAELDWLGICETEGNPKWALQRLLQQNLGPWADRSLENLMNELNHLQDCPARHALRALRLLSGPAPSCRVLLCQQNGTAACGGQWQMTFPESAEDSVLKVVLAILACRGRLLQEGEQPVEGLTSWVPSPDGDTQSDARHRQFDAGFVTGPFAVPGHQAKQSEVLDWLQREKIAVLTNVECAYHPEYAVRLLQRAAASLEEVRLCRPGLLHLGLLLQSAPLLRRLHVLDYVDSAVSATALHAGQDPHGDSGGGIGGGLGKPSGRRQHGQSEERPGAAGGQLGGLRCLKVVGSHCMPPQTLLALLAAHAPTLQELWLLVGTPADDAGPLSQDDQDPDGEGTEAPGGWPAHCEELHLLLGRNRLRALRRVVLLRPEPHRPALCHDQLSAVERALPGANVLCQHCDDVDVEARYLAM